MVLYEKIAFEDTIRNYESVELNTLVDGRKTSILDKARALKVNHREFYRQVRLHAPQFPFNQYMDRLFLNKNVYPILESIFSEYPDNFSYYCSKCGADYLDVTLSKDEELIIKKSANEECDASIVISNKLHGHVKYKEIAKLYVREVGEDVGKYLESNLHYLHAFRKDAKYRFGLFVENHTFPICYVSFSDIDRDDKIQALQKSLNFSIDNFEAIELSRVFGCGKLPKNAISFLVAASTRYFNNYKYIITAVNLNLGFSGKSMLATGFVPYAFRPVNYSPQS